MNVRVKNGTEGDWELVIQDVRKTRTEFYTKSPTKKTESPGVVDT
jgi:hypothetical protein